MLSVPDVLPNKPWEEVSANIYQVLQSLRVMLPHISAATAALKLVWTRGSGGARLVLTLGRGVLETAQEAWPDRPPPAFVADPRDFLLLSVACWWGGYIGVRIRPGSLLPSNAV